MRIFEEQARKKSMLSLGYDIGSSFVKCCIFDCETGRTVVRGSSPQEEMKIVAPRPGWAEQDPEEWWRQVGELTRNLMRKASIGGEDIASIGISYQMHGLVLVDARKHVLRPSIIWCDSRAVEIGRNAFSRLGEKYCLGSLLNSPGNFTASKLRWVKENEPETFRRIHKAMLPGDYIAMRLTGEITTTISGLSEGIYWDFLRNAISGELLTLFEIDEGLIPDVVPTFSVQGRVNRAAAKELGLKEGTPVAYRAGDQPNNAFSLDVLRPGEIAATAGTSGVVYGVVDKLVHDPRSRVNPFAHVTHSAQQTRLGVLLCINGTGILNSWLRKNVAAGESYEELNAAAGKVDIGSEGLVVIPFGNGAERMLDNNNIGAHIAGMEFNLHSRAHLLRAAQEGIAFSFRYGMDIMREMGIDLNVIRAGHANMFLSPVFRETLANAAGATIELYDTDGAEGSARGSAVGAGLFPSMEGAFTSLKKTDEVLADRKKIDATAEAYGRWVSQLRRLTG